MHLEDPTAAANAAGFSAVSTAAIFLSMTVSKVRAGASGILRFPSQCLMASRLNPNVLENLACVMPSQFRIAGRRFEWQAAPKTNLKTHALKGSPTQLQTTSCTSNLLHSRHNKINEMRTRHWSGCPEGARKSGLANNVASVCWILCEAKESFRRTIQHPAFQGYINIRCLDLK